jgi:hypothetical protein
MFQSKRTVYFAAALFSILLSLFSILQKDVLNPDGICYVQSAESIKNGLHYAMNLCGQAKWPFYSVLISGVHFITSFSYENSAYLLNSLFSLVSVLTFIGIVSLLKNTKQNILLLWLAAFVILFSHILNDVRHYIIRDHGYFAFYLLAIFFLLKFFREPKWDRALAFGCFSILATLFRLEGAIFLVLVPFITFLDFRFSFWRRVKAFLQLNALSILGGIGVCVILYFLPIDALGRLHEINPHRAVKFFSVFQLKAEALAHGVLSEHAVGDARVILFFTLVVWYLYSAITNVSLIYMALVVYAWRAKLMQTARMLHIVIWAYLLINIALTAVFLTENMFISKRYLIAQSLILMLWVPFALLALVQQWKTRRSLVTLVFVLIILSSLSGVISMGHSKRYIYDAGTWLQKNMPPDAKLFSNDILVMYYSHHFGDSIFAVDKLNGTARDLSQYDYIALRVNKKDRKNASDMQKQIASQPVQVFHNSRGDEVVIYRR